MAKKTNSFVSADKFTQSMLESLTKEWQKRLRLQDWDVKVGFKRHYDMNDPANEAEMQMNSSLKRARVRLSNPADYCNEFWPYDVEGALVHELLHIHFESMEHGIPKDDPRDIAKEQAIDLIALALVNAKRGVV